MKRLALLLSLVLATLTASAQTEVKNVIYMIGDGMGLVQVTAAKLYSETPLAIERARYVGLQSTWSADNEVTDSAASGTALSTGQKTYNGAIGVTPDKQPAENIREKAAKTGRSTGVVATYSVTNATPAAFVAHDESRSNEFAIAEDYLDSDIDVFFGGGLRFFEKRTDGRNLSEEMTKKGYFIAHSMEELKKAPRKVRTGALLADNALPRYSKGRGEMLPEATAIALEILSQNPKGFFVMIEGSQIDGGGHDNSGEEIVSETIDFDNAVRVALDFADRNPGTLVLITADHETGGFTLPESSRKATYKFSTGGHTATMVPVYAYGAGAENFTGVMDNTDIPKKIARLIGAK